MASRLYIPLKATNLALATVWSFFSVYVLIRALGQTDYALVIVTSAVSSYVMATDLGLSSVVYSKMRHAFVDGRPLSESHLPVTAYFAYVIVALLATGLFGSIVGLAAIGSPKIRLAAILYFLSLSLALPWSIVRVSLGAVDQFIRFETTESARRASMILLVAGVHFGLPFIWYVVLSLALWAAAYAAIGAPMLGQLKLNASNWIHHFKPFEFFRQMSSGWRSAGTFSIAEFAIYNFPYLYIPFAYPQAGNIIIFDTFYKVTRFGAQAYLVINEGLLPLNSRAMISGDRATLYRNILIGLALCALPSLIGVLSVTTFGRPLFQALLGGRVVIPAEAGISMAVMLIAMLFQATAGTLLLYTGHARMLGRVAAFMALGVAGCALIVRGAGFDFMTFLPWYVGVFAVGSCIYFASLLKLIRVMP